MEADSKKIGRRLLMISTDRKIFEEGSSVRARQIEYAKGYDEVHIVIFSGKDFNEQVIAPNCWVYPTRSNFKLKYPFDAIRLGRFIIEKRGITEITCQDASLTAMAGVSLKKQFGLPLEIQVHEDLGSPYYAFNFTNKIRKFLAKSYLPKADSIRVVSDRIKYFIEGSLGIDSNKVTVRPITVDIQWIKDAPITIDLHKKYPQFEKIILMASRLEAEKNIQLAINAMAKIVKDSARVGLVIVGNGSLKGELESFAKTLNISNDVVFESWADPQTLASYYKTADIYLNTSLFEGYGMTFVEAQAAGCKIVSTDVGVAREVGAVIAEHDPKSVAAGIIQVLGVKSSS